MMEILNLGCGRRKIENALNADINPEYKPDRILDFNHILPFDNNTFDKVVMHHSIEHSTSLSLTFEEALRVGKQLELTVPSPRSRWYNHETHNYFFSIVGLRGKTRNLPYIMQRLLGLFIPNEWVITIRKRG